MKMLGLVLGATFAFATFGACANWLQLPENPTPSQKKAAAELETYVRRVTGRAPDFAVRFAPATPDLGEDGFRLQMKDGTLTIAGGRRGILYGVYEVLERFAGCGWFSPTTEVVPKLDKIAIPDGLDETHKPAFSVRSSSCGPLGKPPDPVFAVRMRVNHRVKPDLTEELGGPALTFAQGLSIGHTFNTLVPPEVWFKTHPEYFSERGGRRRDGREVQLCLTNPDVLKIVVSNLLERLEKTPGAKFVGVSQNDNNMYCECPKCAEVDAYEESHCGTLLRFLNAVAAELGKTHPDVRVESLIYTYSRKLPKHTKPHPNVVPCLCPYECRRHAPLADERVKANAAFMADLRAWAGVSDNIYIWDYLSNFRNYMYPYMVEGIMQPNLKTFRDHHVKYMFTDAWSHHSDFAELKAYLLAKWMWNPDLDEKALTDKFFAGYYGAAAPFVREYYERCLAEQRKEAAAGKPLAIFIEKPPTWYTREFTAWAREKYRAAAAAVKDDPVRLRNVRFAELVPMVVELDRHAEQARYYHVTRHPENFPRCADLDADYRTVLELMDDAKKVGEPIKLCAGPIWDPDKLAAWKRVYGGRQDAAAKDWLVLRGDDFFIVSARHCRSSREGLRLLPSSGGAMVKLNFRNVAYDVDATYRVRFRAKVVKGGRDGAAFRAMLGKQETIEKKTSEVGDDWTWYEFKPRRLVDALVFSFGSGPWERGGGTGTTKEVILDCVEISRVDPDCAAKAVQGGQFVLAEKGVKGVKDAALPCAASPSCREAARKLDVFARRITGEGLHARVLFEPPPAELGEDGYHIYVKDGALHIAAGRRGCLYAVFEILERFGGCGWFSSTTSVVPSAPRLAVPADLDLTEKPAFELRCTDWSDVRWHPELAAKLRLNGVNKLPEQLGGEAWPYAPGCGICHTFNLQLPSEKWFKDHPEYFCERDGRRRSGRETQPCLSNPEVLRIVTDYCLKQLAAHPEAKLVGISQNDNQMYCTCEKCRAIDEAEGSHGGTLLRFVNAAAAEIEKVRPDVLVQTLIYQYTRKAPKITKARHNVTPCLCNIECRRQVPLNCPTDTPNARFMEDLKEWAGLSDKLYIWDYTTNYRNYLYPMPIEHTLQTNMKLFRDHGVKFMFPEGGGKRADFAELKAYLLAKWMWNPDLDEKTLTDKFFAGYYGAAAPFVREYYEKCQVGVKANPKGVIGIFNQKPPAFYTPAFAAEARTLFARAKQAVARDKIRLANVRFAELVPMTVQLDRAAETAKWFFVTREPEKFPAVDDALKADYHAALALRKEAGKGFTFCAGPVWDPDKMADWRRTFAETPDRTAKDAVTVASDGLFVVSRRHTKNVKEPEAAGGHAESLLPSSGGPMLRLSFRNVAFDADAAYTVRFRVKVEKDGEGAKEKAAFRATLGPAGAKAITNLGESEGSTTFAEAIEKTTAEVEDGWAWYSFRPTKLKESFAFEIGSGPWNHGGGIGATKRVLFDRLEIALSTNH